MRHPVLLAVTVGTALAGAAVIGRAQAPATPPTTTAPAATPAAEVKETTSIKGTPPDLRGRWLVLAHITLAQGTGRTLPVLWDVTGRGSDLRIHERDPLLPKAQNDALEKAIDTPPGKWEPTPADLDAIRAAWNDMKLADRNVTDRTYELTAKDAFTDEIKKEPKTKDALWVLSQVYLFAPGPSRPIKQANVYAALAQKAAEWTGNFTAVTIAAAPFPVPITFNGTFRMIPLDAVAERGFLARVGDFFKGCGR